MQRQLNSATRLVKFHKFLGLIYAIIFWGDISVASEPEMLVEHGTPIQRTSSPPLIASAQQRKKQDRRLGIMVDVGLPDGLGINFVVRPVSWFQLHAGGDCLVYTGGIRGGISFAIPTGSRVSPSLTFDIGYQFPRDLNWLIGTNTPWLQHVGFMYGDLQVGIEIKIKQNWNLFFHAGVSYLRGSLGDVQGTTQISGKSISFQILENTETAIIPSLKFGFIYYFW